MKTIIALIISALLVACQDPSVPNALAMLAGGDRRLPTLVSRRSLDMDSMVLTFDQEVHVMDCTVDGVDAEVGRPDGQSVVIHSPVRLDVSVASEVFIRVRDARWNSAAFRLQMFGLNARIPELMINEFSSKGTETQPDRIELEVHSSGNLEGLCLMDGTKGNERHSLVLGDIEVERGDYVVVYWDSVPDEAVTRNPDGSRILHIAGGSDEGLASNNGAFVIYPTASGDGEVIDCLVYTNGEATTWSGFGSAAVEASYKELTASFDWMGEAFNSRNATSTRTVSRRPDRDTDSAGDFYITVTRGETFGRMNTSAEYYPED